MPNPPRKRASPAPPSRPAPRSASRRKRERRREDAMRALSHPRRGSRRGWIWYGGGAAIVVLVVVIVLLARNSPTPAPNPPAPTVTPTSSSLLLAPVSTAATGAPTDGIQCQTNEQLVYHIHAHLAVYVNGVHKLIPEGVGIAPPRTEVQTDDGPYVDTGSCFYWLHTHTNDGIIHIESPTEQSYTLGQFFDIWNQPLSSTAVGPATGTLTVYVNGQRYTGDPRAITLTAHELIQIDVGTDVPPQPFTFPVGL